MKKHIWLALPVCLIGVLASCGNSGFDVNRNISITVREDGSGTKSAFLEIIGLKGAADPEGAILATGTTAVLQEVASNPYAIAYESLGYVDDSVKMLTVDGAASTVANIKSGSYKISRPLNVIYKDADIKASTLYTDYLNFLGSKDAQDIVSNEGYCSIVDGATEFQVLRRVYIPMCKSTIATVTLFFAISRWNGYFWARQMISNSNEHPLQVFIRLRLEEYTDP